MKAAVVTVWRTASTDHAKQAVAALEEAGHRAKHKGRTITVSHHPEATDGVTATVNHIDPHAERQPS
jgi:hypothetical protein